MNARVRELQLAAMILTRLPAGRIDGDAPPISASIWAFPVIGAGVGAIAGIAFVAASWLGLPALAAALVAIAAGTLATGALHEDGLADTADGFGGGGTVARKLEIMKDSRIGSYGVLALVLTVGLTASAVASAGTAMLFIAIGAASRAMMLLPMTFLRPAREDGLGRSATTQADTRFIVATIVTLAVMLVANSMLVLAVMLATSVAVMILARRQIGGQTGDVLGATQKLSECTGWLTAAALLA